MIKGFGAADKLLQTPFLNIIYRSVKKMLENIFPMLETKRTNIGEQIYENFLYDMITGTITGHAGELKGRIEIPDDIHGVEIRAIGTGAFTGCTGITELVLGHNIAEIETGAFSGCSGIKKLTLSENLKYIGNAAFMGCTALEAVKIPKGVQHIGEQAFFACPLKDTKIPEGIPYIAADAF